MSSISVTDSDALKEYEQKALAACLTVEQKQRVCFNVLNNGNLLRSRFKPETLCQLSDEDLRDGSVVQQLWNEMRAKAEIYRDLVAQDPLEGTENRPNTVKCRNPNCRREGAVMVTTRQTRSADEGSTVFCECGFCNYRWRMG